MRYPTTKLILIASEAPGATESRYIEHLSSNSSNLLQSFPSNIGGLANFKRDPGRGTGAANGIAGAGKGAAGHMGGGCGAKKGVGALGGIKGVNPGAAGATAPPGIPTGKGVWCTVG